MSATHIQTKSLRLVLKTPEEILAGIEAMEPSVKAQVSPDWLARVRASTAPDPWTHGYALVHRATDIVIGQAGFKGPPGKDGVVEIAYAVAPDYEGKGYATEAAQALTDYAMGSGQVRLVRAHTIAKDNASARVLVKSGFRLIGEVMDPEDGRVWRWEQPPS
jgi:RimJ/RimL family protein N-acetyltransferase